MTVTIISKGVALTKTVDSLRLHTHGPAQGVTPAIIAQALRRAAHILAPCPAHALEHAVLLSLTPLASDAVSLATGIAETLETLLAYGDILEMRIPADDPWTISPLIIRPAPPAFVIRKDGCAIILGVAGDEITPLAGGATTRLTWHGVLRTLRPQPSDNLQLFLTELGLIELNEKTWLHLPTIESASRYTTAWSRHLSEAVPIPVIEGLLVLDTRQSPTYYSGRWVEPRGLQNGLHIARRPQKYGAPLWCIVDIDAGSARRFLDLSSQGGRDRPCDLAWRIQMALDAVAGAPQQVRLRTWDNRQVFDFFSPLPSWAERKLAVAGERIAPYKCLISYAVATPVVDETIKFLKDYLWIAPEA